MMQKSSLYVILVLMLAAAMFVVSCDNDADVSSDNPKTTTTTTRTDSGTGDDSSEDNRTGLTLKVTIHFTDETVDEVKTVAFLYGINGYDEDKLTDLTTDEIHVTKDASTDARIITVTFERLDLSVGDTLHYYIRMLNADGVCIGNMREVGILEKMKSAYEERQESLTIDGVYGDIDIDVSI